MTSQILIRYYTWFLIRKSFSCFKADQEFDTKETKGFQNSWGLQ